MLTKRIVASLVGAVAILGVTIPSASAGTQALSCKTSVGSTGGWAECKGAGTWRVVSICTGLDKYTSWITTTGGTTRIYAVDCEFNIERVQVEQK